MSSKRRRKSAGAVVFLLVLIVAVGYLWADAKDLLPGYLTMSPPPGPAAEFPTPPGAVEPGDTAAAPGGATAVLPQTDVDIAAAVKDLVTDKKNVGKSISVIVSDAVTGQIIAAHKPNKPMTPASVQKALVALAGSEELDLDATLKTTVVQSSASEIVLVGGGDMMLSAEAGDPTVVNGRAGLADLAAQAASALELRGETTVRLVYDTSLFDANTHGVWEQSPAQGYAAPVVPFAINVGRMSDGEYAPRYDDPAGEAAKVFAARLAERGITVDGAPRSGKAVSGGKTVATVESAPVRDLIEHFMRYSDNTITEVVGRLVAIHRGLPASFDGAAKAVLATLSGMGIDVSGASLKDCSGLAEGSKVMPETIIEVIDRLATPGEGTFHDAATGMPISGWTGTLAERMTSDDARGNVRAKTGSLPKVVALAGTIQTSSQRPLNFVVIADRSPNTWSTRKVIDDFVTGLTA
ncbi:D-alanyl-D-alanine carboxypeptidase/D-alanyl-D-alanine-endopeptidase [Rarobacter faecitabidus]|uniref:D-alanyl-D-alanine carboxypeptidase/D-alanyl-D-alanine-endopeptidase (Penicillin-binding protein 4) n=1 Tax=Rarobacter faecitabidus TaxID=13243 RepID=A0A542ZTI2_RARFA|nr:D-alanyl-D-alanine carboxypeptidase/D-alanyl-D-alanine-endopeptidase [Rarobacter faecitabidus]TQL63668.1 D-alanyl-D-alanine carboxypeptidase/D-alanyl-D-alanine-endopeptidase (penicillin-binding protein 4) [Rarobacter faecitabidus]